MKNQLDYQSDSSSMRFNYNTLNLNYQENYNQNHKDQCYKISRSTHQQYYENDSVLKYIGENQSQYGFDVEEKESFRGGGKEGGEGKVGVVRGGGQNEFKQGIQSRVNRSVNCKKIVYDNNISVSNESNKDGNSKKYNLNQDNKNYQQINHKNNINENLNLEPTPVHKSLTQKIPNRPKNFIQTSQKTRRTYIKAKKGTHQETNDLTTNVCTLIKSFTLQYETFQLVQFEEKAKLEEFRAKNWNLIGLKKLLTDGECDLKNDQVNVLRKECKLKNSQNWNQNRSKSSSSSNKIIKSSQNNHIQTSNLKSNSNSSQKIQPKIPNPTHQPLPSPNTQPQTKPLNKYLSQRLQHPQTLKQILLKTKMKFLNKIILLKYYQTLYQMINNPQIFTGWKSFSNC